MPGSHSRAFIVRLFEHFVPSKRNASSDIALPASDSHLSASVRRGAMAKGCAHARLVPPPANPHFVLACRPFIDYDRKSGFLPARYRNWRNKEYGERTGFQR